MLFAMMAVSTRLLLPQPASLSGVCNCHITLTRKIDPWLSACPVTPAQMCTFHIILRSDMHGHGSALGT